METFSQIFTFLVFLLVISEEGISGNDDTYSKIPFDDVVENKLQQPERLKKLSEQEL